MDFSFGPEFRLHYPWEYKRFFEGSEILRLPGCSVFRVPNECGHFRVGITLKTKLNSVGRNRVKRTIRESFRHLKNALGSFDYNVVVSVTRELDPHFARRLAVMLQNEFPKSLHLFKPTVKRPLRKAK